MAVLKRVKRQPEFDLSVQLKRDDFIDPPRLAQRNWVLNRALGEFSQELYALDARCAHSDGTAADESCGLPWHARLAQCLADVVPGQECSILEIGVDAPELTPLLMASAPSRQVVLSTREIELDPLATIDESALHIERVIGGLNDAGFDEAAFDAVLLNVLPEFGAGSDDPFAPLEAALQNTLAAVPDVLRDGGIFAFISNDIDSLGRRQQRELLQHFSAVEIRLCRDLVLPLDPGGEWWADSLVVVKATL